ncbi:hypothetical protein PWT90_09670 [Aphanocladium album]|nr:hypothetical protein PWT90_09670 [Aphanocladium album]
MTRRAAASAAPRRAPSQHGPRDAQQLRLPVRQACVGERRVEAPAGRGDGLPQAEPLQERARLLGGGVVAFGGIAGVEIVGFEVIADAAGELELLLGYGGDALPELVALNGGDFEAVDFNVAAVAQEPEQCHQKGAFAAVGDSLANVFLKSSRGSLPSGSS